MENGTQKPVTLSAQKAGRTASTLTGSSIPITQEEVFPGETKEASLVASPSKEKEFLQNSEGNGGAGGSEDADNRLSGTDTDLLLDSDDAGPKARRASTSILPRFRGGSHKTDGSESQWKPSEVDKKAILPLLNVYNVRTLGGYEDIDLFTQEILPRLTSTVATIISITKTKQQGNFVFMYTIQICKKTVHGTIEIHLVSKSLKSFYDFHKALKQSAPELELEPPQKKMFESEGEILLKNKKQELQRYIDTIFIDNELMLLPCVVRFFELQKRYDYIIPRMTLNKWNEIMSVNEKSKEPVKDFADNLRKEYSKLKLENAALKSRIQELSLNEAAANIKVGSLSERIEYYKEAETLHEREVASIRAWATTAINTLKEQLASKQREIDTLIKNTNTLEERNVQLRSELSNLREKSAACSAALDTKTKLCTVLEKRVTELEATCAAQKSTIMWFNRELDLWRLGGEDPSTGESKVVGPTANAYEEKWREAQGELQAIQLRSEQLAERVRTLEALNESGVFENGRGGRRGSVCGIFHGAQGRDTELRMDVIGARNGCTDRSGKNEIYKLIQINREKELELDLTRKELETVRAEGKRVVEQMEALRAERQKDFERYLSLDSTIKEKEGEIRTLNGNIFQQELLIWLLEFQNRELLHEVGSLTLSLDKLGEAPAKETERTRLMYSGQYLEGLDALEVVEKQNSYMKEKIHELSAELSHITESSSTEIASTKLDLARCRAELKREHERSQRLALLASKNGLKTEDIEEDEFTSVLSLKETVRKLEAEVGDIKQRYFFYLAMTIKLQTGGRCQLDELYNELLADKSVQIDGWSKWINMKMGSSLTK